MGHIYIAPGDQHLVIKPPPVSLGLNDEPKENFISPSGDVLFDSVGKVFGEFCVAVILSGMGRDGARGAGTIKAGGGAVFVESPGKSSSPFDMIGEAITHQVTLSNKKLWNRKKQE